MSIRRFIAVLVAFIALNAPNMVRAVDVLSAERLSNIQSRCSTLQTNLDQLQRRDLVSRTDHGRQYENLIKQIDAFAERLRSNNLPDTLLAESTADFKAAVASFREAYIAYDDGMNALRAVDCVQHAGDFAQLLEEAKTLRAAVGTYVNTSENALSRYRAAMVIFQNTLPRVESATRELP